MFCKNCGSPMNDNAAVCVSCGVAKGREIIFALTAVRKLIRPLPCV